MMMLWCYRSLLVPPESSERPFWNIPEHSTEFGWDSQICQCSCQLYPDFELSWGLNATSILEYHPFIYLCLVPSVLSLLPSFHTGTIARTMPGCHHIKHQQQRARERARADVTATERQRERERERQMKKETENYSVARKIWLCIKEKLRGKNFLLNWLYVHEKRNHNVSLSLSLSQCVALSASVSWCQLSTRYQCLLLHIAIKSSFLCVFFFLCSAARCFHSHLPTTYFLPLTMIQVCI